MSSARLLVEEALRVLGVRNLVLGIQDPSFPSLEDEDIGRGSPTTEGGRRFLRFVRDLGFTGLQLGPQGQTSEDNPSPYDGTIFSRGTLSIALSPLTEEGRWGGLLPRARIDSILASRPDTDDSKVQHRYAYRAHRAALDEAYSTFVELRDQGAAGVSGGARARSALAIAERLEAFRREHDAWLERDALYEPLCQEHASPHWRSWGGDQGRLDQRLFRPGPSEEAAGERRREDLRARYSSEIERHAFFQLIAHEQHQELRELTTALGLKLYGDLQIGYSEQDVWSYQSLFLTSYRMGAPPSRTNPEGQPWNYPVLDPAQYIEGQGGGAAPGPALRLLLARINKLFTEFDGIRIDHPHGLVDPWVYRASEADTQRAVQAGARLFSSPDLSDHPELARFAVVAPDQVNHAVPRYADDWVTTLLPDQVHRYGALFDAIIGSARKNGRQVSDLVCEVLSTKPYPLKRVLEQYGLGRFRVTQKANLTNLADVYRSENARPEDWIMVGNHDTKPIWLLAAEWSATNVAGEQANYLASRLLPDEAGRSAFAEELATNPKRLAQAKLAELFTSRAQNVMIFFSDLFGIESVFNAPGTVNDENWRLRVPRDYEQFYSEKLAEGGALNLPKALAMALRARAGRGEIASAHADLIARLEEVAIHH